MEVFSKFWYHNFSNVKTPSFKIHTFIEESLDFVSILYQRNAIFPDRKFNFYAIILLSLQTKKTLAGWDL